MERPKSIRTVEDLQLRLARMGADPAPRTRPFVTVSYAQSIDGSIATGDRRPIGLSGPGAMMLTHRLRALFDGILVGIGTLLADDPRLDVRLVQGSNPQPVVLDTRLRTPAGCRLLQRKDRTSWLASAADSPLEARAALTRQGAGILPCPLDPDGRIDLGALSGMLWARGIRSLMIEGGARVITSFIRARLVDQFVITIAPTFVGGLPVLDAGSRGPLPRMRLSDVHCQFLDGDLIVWAQPSWGDP